MRNEKSVPMKPLIGEVQCVYLSCCKTSSTNSSWCLINSRILECLVHLSRHSTNCEISSMLLSFSEFCIMIMPSIGTGTMCTSVPVLCAISTYSALENVYSLKRCLTDSESLWHSMHLLAICYPLFNKIWFVKILLRSINQPKTLYHCFYSWSCFQCHVCTLQRKSPCAVLWIVSECSIISNG